MKTMKLLLLSLAAVLSGSCNVQDIAGYRAEDSVADFESNTVSFSIRGIDSDEIILDVPLKLTGVVTDYDRPVSVSVVENERNTAVEGTDFQLGEACVKAGEMKGSIVLSVKKLPEGVTSMTTTFKISPNEYFRQGTKGYSSAVIMWSAEYVRPPEYVWRSWWYFFSNGYSRALHEIIIGLFGDEVETYTHNKYEGYVFKSIDWWYAANRQLREYVSEYDKAHPDAPLMHSSDYEYYKSYLTAVGNGTKPDEIPTIAETLVAY